VLSIEELCALVEDATQSMPGRVVAGTELATLDGWDSMGLVVFIGLIQDRAQLELLVHELRACATPVDVHELIRRELAAR